MEDNQQSPFYKAITESFDVFKSLVQPNDSALLVITDGQHCSHVFDGSIIMTTAMLATAMEESERVASSVIDAVELYKRNRLTASTKTVHITEAANFPATPEPPVINNKEN